MILNDRLELFRNMILCCHDLYLWTYDQDMVLESSNCPDEAVVSGLLAIGNHLQDTVSYAQGHNAPLLLTNEISLMWIADPEQDEKGLRHIHVLGPFYIESMSMRAVEEHLSRMGYSAALRQSAIRFLRSLPVITLSRALEYAIMLHYCVSGERIGVSDMNYWDAASNVPEIVHPENSTDIHGTYEAEQEMLRMVREGDWENLKNHLNKMSTLGSMGKLSCGDPVRQMKNAVEVCTTLFSRAAIEGGLAPEVSYTLTDHYFQKTEACTFNAELMDVCMTMQEDFVTRVHKCRQKDGISKAVRTCADYIDLHVEDEITLKTLAGLSSYSEYYISKLFKKETGYTPAEYLRKKRLERAKFLLRTTRMDIQQISEVLHFCSGSYFADAFRREVGVSPTRWRELETVGKDDAST